MDREVLEGSVNLKVGEYIFECDRKELASNSPYFHAMFSGNFAEKSQSEIQLNVSTFQLGAFLCSVVSRDFQFEQSLMAALKFCSRVPSNT